MAGFILLCTNVTEPARLAFSAKKSRDLWPDKMSQKVFSKRKRRQKSRFTKRVKRLFCNWTSNGYHYSFQKVADCVFYRGQPINILCQNKLFAPWFFPLFYVELNSCKPFHPARQQTSLLILESPFRAKRRNLLCLHSPHEIRCIRYGFVFKQKHVDT